MSHQPFETPPSDDDVAKYAQLALRDYCVYAVCAVALTRLLRDLTQVAWGLQCGSVLPIGRVVGLRCCQLGEFNKTSFQMISRVPSPSFKLFSTISSPFVAETLMSDTSNIA